MLPWARSGIVGASALGLGRAVGETIAIALLLGNTPNVDGSLLGPGLDPGQRHRPRAGEATGLHLSALTALAVVLFVIAFVINAAARALVTRSADGAGHLHPRSPAPSGRAARRARSRRRTGPRRGAAGRRRPCSRCRVAWTACPP